MKIKTVWAVYFSPAGSTKNIAVSSGKLLAAELGADFKEIDFTLPAAREETYHFSQEELVIFAMPVYAGKIPNKMLPYVKDGFSADGSALIALSVFGNRAFDNALSELRAVLENSGFICAAGAGLASRHVFSKILGKNRPDSNDGALLNEFLKNISAALKSSANVPHAEDFPGDADAAYYTPLGTDSKPAKFLKAKPKTDMNKCTDCKICANVCPLSSISFDTVNEVPGICIKCQACVLKCPENAKYFDDESFLSHVKMIEQNYIRPAENSFFYPKI